MIVEKHPSTIIENLQLSFPKADIYNFSAISGDDVQCGQPLKP